MSLLLAIAASTVTATCVPAKEPEETREEVVDSFFDAMARHDAAALGRYIRPGAKVTMGSDSMDLAEMMSALNPNAKPAVLGKAFNQDKTITVRFRADAEDDETALTIAQDGGCIVGMTQV